MMEDLGRKTTFQVLVIRLLLIIVETMLAKGNPHGTMRTGAIQELLGDSLIFVQNVTGENTVWWKNHE